MPKVVQFKSKEDQFKSWFYDMWDANFKDQPAPESAILIFESKDENGKSLAHEVHFGMTMENYNWFLKCFEDKVRELQFDDWMQKNIDKYIQIINS